ncbi:hypothetical protein SS50377_24761 [Spironucleus salmonicida]|uniref:Uncharacterized protein n=1 Tax=Spironucleus salmonicida TaxID=348837 RepID=V6LLJ6_9EUKA|nr:hypothetical protein SS50377_24761 [Spironucleus salmonicida]|eukprot:EST44641.1 hypothetical protein SS50377_15649 [Spironucleus salmonicida]
MFAICRQDNSWFQKCAQGEIEFIKSHVKNIKRRDPRQAADGVFPNFTGLMYAAYYGQLEVFKFLFEHEINLNIIEQTVIHCKNVNLKYVLASDSSVTFIAIAREQPEILQFIQDKQALINSTNTIGQNASLFAISVNSEVGFNWVFDSQIFPKEIIVQSADGMNVLSNCGYFGRQKYMEQIYNIFSNPDKFENLELSKEMIETTALRIKSLVKQVDEDGQTAKELAIQVVEYEKFSTSKEEKQAVFELIEKIENE